MVFVGLKEQLRRFHFVEVANSAVRKKDKRLNEFVGSKAKSNLGHTSVYLSARVYLGVTPQTTPRRQSPGECRLRCWPVRSRRAPRRRRCRCSRRNVRA